MHGSATLELAVQENGDAISGHLHFVHEVGVQDDGLIVGLVPYDTPQAELGPDVQAQGRVLQQNNLVVAKGERYTHRKDCCVVFQCA